MLLGKINPFLLLGSGAAVGYLRNLYAPALSWIERKLWISVTVAEPDTMYYALDTWLTSTGCTEKVKNLYAKKSYRYYEKSEKINIVPGFGVNFFKYRSRRIVLVRTKTEHPGANEKQPESITMKILFGNRNELEEILQIADKEYSHIRQVTESVYLWDIQYEGCWSGFDVITRNLDSVILPKEVKEKILNTLNKFLSDKEFYLTRGIPYRLGILFEGIPGSGKTSLIAALAKELNKKLYIMSLASLTDTGFIKSVAKIPVGSIVLFEDVDILAPSRENGTPMKVSLSTFLNVMDGFLGGRGTIFFLTTNHAEKLDPALLRTGRIDLKCFFSYADSFQKSEMYKKFFPLYKENELFDFLQETKDKNLSMSDVQNILISR